MSNFYHVINRRLEDITRRYDGDNDVIPGAPSVTWSDMQLVEIANALLDFTVEQGKKINRLNDRLEKLEKFCACGTALEKQAVPPKNYRYRKQVPHSK